MKFRYVFLFIILSVLFSDIQAQVGESLEKQNIRVIARSFGDSIILRWAPSSSEAWVSGNSNGYMIERYTVLKDGEVTSFEERSTAKNLVVEPLKPFPQSEWESLVDQDDYAGIAAQAIYGGSFQVDGGGSDLVAIANMEKEQQNRFGFSLFAADQSSLTATAMGLRFKDVNIRPNEKYLYRVYLAKQPPAVEVDTGFVFIGAADQEPLPKPMQVQAEWGDSTALISWNQVYYQQYYSSYILERSDDGGQTFRQVHETPLVNTAAPGSQDNRMYYMDDLPENGKVFMYQVKGRSYFEEIGPPSDLIQGKGIPAPIESFANVQKVEVVDNGLEISWTFRDDILDDIKGFEIYRAPKDNGEYELISDLLPNTTRKFVDESPLSVNYYKVYTVDKNDYRIASFSAMGQTDDTIPPAPPIEIVGAANKNGIVTLTWNKGKELDLYGYRVYYATNKDDEFAQITKTVHQDTVFTHTLSTQTMTEEAYFKIRAYDFRENTSEYSKIVTVKRPDNIPPTPPVFRKLVASDTGVFVSWANSSSPDVLYHELQRKPVFQREWNVVETFDSLTIYTDYVDTLASYKYLYEYRVVAFDDDSLFSYSKFLETKPIDNGIRPPLENVESEPDRREKSVVITWDYPMDEKPERFLVYRSVGEEPLRSYSYISAKELKEKGTESKPFHSFEFRDKKVKMDTEYTYKVQAIYTNGAMSYLTEPIIVEY